MWIEEHMHRVGEPLVGSLVNHIPEDGRFYGIWIGIDNLANTDLHQGVIA